ncbi:hypothetical protein [Rhodopila sp.]|uniref:hypothetical protein n=1 Tax=Rhodopila sp. TaxID=2480087 RepID=UPI003D114A51
MALADLGVGCQAAIRYRLGCVDASAGSVDAGILDPAGFGGALSRIERVGAEAEDLPNPTM